MKLVLHVYIWYVIYNSSKSYSYVRICCRKDFFPWSNDGGTFTE